MAPSDPNIIYVGSGEADMRSDISYGNGMYKSTDAGSTWTHIGLEDSRQIGRIIIDPHNADMVFVAALGHAYAPNAQRGVIYTVAPSPLRAGEIWIGTDDGVIQVTRDDGKTWHNVTPAELTPWSKVGILEASRHDANTVYAAVDRHRLDDLHPHIYRTHDGGKTWREIAKGIPEGSYVQAVREDPVRRGLLYAGTETGVFVSFNDGDEWQPLQLNLPTASVRDLVVHNDDLVIGTHGRSFWILDDVTPLRQLSASVAAAEVSLFRPQTALRVRSASYEGTPLPPEEPQGENPPHGAIINYYLKSRPSEPIKLEILDRAGKLVRRYTSADKPPQVDPKTLEYPMYWIHPEKPLSAEPGMHRVIWDVHYAALAEPPTPAASRRDEGAGPWAPPGQYAVRLTANGHSTTHPLTLKMDPRVKTPTADLFKQFALAQQVDTAKAQIQHATREGNQLHTQPQSLGAKLDERQKLSAQDPLAAQVETLNLRLKAMIGTIPPPNLDISEDDEAAANPPSMRSVEVAWGLLEKAIESADAAPTPDAVTAFAHDQQLMQRVFHEWAELKGKDLRALNDSLRQATVPPLALKSSSKESDASKN